MITRIIEPESARVSRSPLRYILSPISESSLLIVSFSSVDSLMVERHTVPMAIHRIVPRIDFQFSSVQNIPTIELDGPTGLIDFKPSLTSVCVWMLREHLDC
jgi:hypothetical protein